VLDFQLEAQRSQHAQEYIHPHSGLGMLDTVDGSDTHVGDKCQLTLVEALPLTLGLHVFGYERGCCPGVTHLRDHADHTPNRLDCLGSARSRRQDACSGILSRICVIAQIKASPNLGRVRVLLISTYELGHQPLHVASPAAALLAAGHEVRCLDLSVEQLEPEPVEWAQAVGISVPMHTALRLGVRMMDRIRAINPGCHLCVYGLYASLNAAHLWKHGASSYSPPITVSAPCFHRCAALSEA